MTDTDSRRRSSSTAQFWIGEGEEQLVLRGRQIDALWERIDADASLATKRETVETVARKVEP